MKNKENNFTPETSDENLKVRVRIRVSYTHSKF